MPCTCCASTKNSPSGIIDRRGSSIAKHIAFTNIKATPFRRQSCTHGIQGSSKPMPESRHRSHLSYPYLSRIPRSVRILSLYKKIFLSRRKRGGIMHVGKAFARNRNIITNPARKLTHDTGTGGCHAFLARRQ